MLFFFPRNAPGMFGQEDFQALAPHVDRFSLMTYDFSNPSRYVNLFSCLFFTDLKINMSRDTRKPVFCLGKSKGADRLRSNCEADQRLCFCYTNSTIPLLKSEISSFYPSVAAQAGLCRTWSETPKTGFLASRLMFLLERVSSFSFLC